MIIMYGALCFADHNQYI